MYLIDLFYSTPPATNAPIIDVVDPANGQTVVNGTFVVRLPDNVALVDPVTKRPLTAPANLGDLLTKKYQALLGAFAGFSNVSFDDLIDTSGINLSAAGTAGMFGQRGSVLLQPGATLTSNTILLAATPQSAVFTWEVFQYTFSDPATDRHIRTYNELPTSPTYTTAQVSFNNGGTFLPVNDLGVFPATLPDQGDQLVVKITNTSPFRLGVGSWAIIY